MDTGTLAVLMVFSIPLAAIIGSFALAALKILRGSGGTRTRAQDAEETKVMQDIYQGLRRMEQRIDALETILLEKERKGIEL